MGNEANPPNPNPNPVQAGLQAIEQRQAAAAPPPAAAQPPANGAPPAPGQAQPGAAPSAEPTTEQLYERIAQLSTENRQLKGKALPSDLEKMSVDERLALVGLQDEAVVDAWAARMQQQAPQQQQNGQPDIRAIVQEELSKLVDTEIKPIKTTLDTQQQQGRRYAEAQTIYGVLQTAKQRWPAVDQMVKNGSIDFAVDTMAQFRALQEKGEYQGPLDAAIVLDHVEKQLRQNAQMWAPVLSIQQPQNQNQQQQGQQQPNQQQAQEPTHLGSQQGAEGTPTPRELNADERLAKAKAIIEQRQRERASQQS